MWRTDLFLGNERKTNDETTAVARHQIFNKQQLNYSSSRIFGNCVFCALHSTVATKKHGKYVSAAAVELYQ
jgi:hypothetical protein